jgi:NADH-quinone oxidoreductase subunit I
MSVGAYFKEIGDAARAIVSGMALTFRYFVRPKEIVTIEYGTKNEARKPSMDYIPERHRGVHYLETEKCIHCHICEKACPVDCIAMDGTRDGPFDGAYKGDGAYMSQFILDLNKCIFCNLCCEPCPKECIHMGQEFDLSAYDRAHGVKNLLTDAPYTKADMAFTEEARKRIEAVEAETKRRRRRRPRRSPRRRKAARPRLLLRRKSPRPKPKSPRPRRPTRTRDRRLRATRRNPTKARPPPRKAPRRWN